MQTSARAHHRGFHAGARSDPRATSSALTLVAAIACTFLTALPPAAASDRSIWLPPTEGPLQVSAPFALPNGPYRAGHRGIDVPAAPGRMIRAPASGSVVFVGTVVDRPVISIRVDGRTVLSLEPVVSDLRVGDAVSRGTAIGAVPSLGGSEKVGGHCGVSCVHLGVRQDGAYVNPLRFLRGRPALLPW